MEKIHPLLELCGGATRSQSSGGNEDLSDLIPGRRAGPSSSSPLSSGFVAMTSPAQEQTSAFCGDEEQRMRGSREVDGINGAAVDDDDAANSGSERRRSVTGLAEPSVSPDQRFSAYSDDTEVLKLLSAVGGSATRAPATSTDALYWALDFLPEDSLKFQKLLIVKHVFDRAKKMLPGFYFIPKPYCSVPFDFAASQSNFMVPFENSICRVVLRRLYLLGRGKFLVVEVEPVEEFISNALVKYAPTFSVIAMHDNTGTYYHHPACKLWMNQVVESRRLLGCHRKDQAIPCWEIGDMPATCILRRHFKEV